MRYKICPNCGVEAEENRVLCPNCGVNIEDILPVDDARTDETGTQAPLDATKTFEIVTSEKDIYFDSNMPADTNVQTVNKDDKLTDSSKKPPVRDKKITAVIIAMVVAIMVVVAIIIALLISGNSNKKEDLTGDTSSSENQSISQESNYVVPEQTSEKTTKETVATEAATTAQSVTYTFRIRLPECIDVENKAIEDVVTVYLNDVVVDEQEVFLNGDIITSTVTGEGNTKSKIDIEINNKNDYESFVFYGKKNESKTVDFSSSSYNDFEEVVDNDDDLEKTE